VYKETESILQTKVVYYPIERRNADFVRISYARSLYREQRNSMIYRHFSTRLLGWFVKIVSRQSDPYILLTSSNSILPDPRPDSISKLC
jgi:hypothetical protein